MLSNEPRERLVNGISASQIKEVFGREDAASIVLVHTNEDLALQVVHGFNECEGTLYLSDNIVLNYIGNNLLIMNIMA